MSEDSSSFTKPRIEIVRFFGKIYEHTAELWRADMVSPSGKRLRCITPNTNLGGYYARELALQDAARFAEVLGLEVVDVDDGRSTFVRSPHMSDLSNEDDFLKWRKYTQKQTHVCIRKVSFYSEPDRPCWPYARHLVAPVDDQKFVLNDFQSQSDAETWCAGRDLIVACDSVKSESL